MNQLLVGVYTFVDKVKQSFWLNYLTKLEDEGNLKSHYPGEYLEWEQLRTEKKLKHLKLTPELKSFKTYMYQKKIS